MEPTVQDLIAEFPRELTGVDTSLLSVYLNKAIAISDGFSGILNENRKGKAVLYLAMYLYDISEQVGANTGLVKKVKSRYDEIEYAVAKSPSSYDYKGSVYGHILKMMLEYVPHYPIVIT